MDSSLLWFVGVIGAVIAFVLIVLFALYTFGTRGSGGWGKRLSALKARITLPSINNSWWKFFRPSLIALGIFVGIILIWYALEPESLLQYMMRRQFWAVVLTCFLASLLFNIKEKWAYKLFGVIMAAVIILSWVFSRESNPAIRNVAGIDGHAPSPLTIRPVDNGQSETQTFPKVYGGKNGDGFYVWVPRLPDGANPKEAKYWSAWIDTAGEREFDAVHRDNKPGTPGKHVADIAPYTEHGDYLYIYRMQRYTCRYVVVGAEESKVLVVVDDDFSRIITHPLKDRTIYGSKTIRFLYKGTEDGCYVKVLWRRNDTISPPT